MAIKNLTANGDVGFDVDQGMVFFVAADGDFGGGTVKVTRSLNGIERNYGTLLVNESKEFRAVADRVTVALGGATDPDVFIAYGSAKES